MNMLFESSIATRAFALVIAVLAYQDVVATSRSYASLEKLVSSSDLVAIVVIEWADETRASARTKNRPYARETSARILEVMKGRASGNVMIFHASGRDDALFQQGNGQYIIFLRKANGGYAPTDGWPSSKPILDGYVLGWSDSHSWSVKDSLANAVAKIRSAPNKK